ncbi:cytochrome P450 monooxygenase [Magnaporthiopsis poae ATCC 64411]|uniref:Cytochrome P450 monooxygenase n=1 Tax=Magnaporthiopsis poae (strain ATCC 64411 / 73-15) TaxID=644358 RepID=A0A0C4E9C3_MAGP6|nr:cytochrome P450 monooxygenase [Magnaporthiopsis poae ATCC 64411]
MLLPELLRSGIHALRGPYLVPAVLGAAFLYVVASYVAAYRRLRHFKGPWLGRFSSLWMLSRIPPGRQGPIYGDVVRKYNPDGPFVRVGPNDLVTNSPDVIRRMSGARSTYKRSAWYHAVKFNPYGDSLLSQTDTAVHDRLKAKMSFAYSGKDVPGLEGLIDEQLASLVDLIRRNYISKDYDEATGTASYKPMNLNNAISFFTLDVIGRISYGKPFGYLAADRDVNNYLGILKLSMRTIVASCDILPLQAVFLNPLFLKYFGPKTTDKEGLGCLMKIAQDIVTTRYGPDAKDSDDMVGSFIRHGVTAEECEQEVLLQIPAGADSTAAGIKGTIMLLCQSPFAYRRLLQEIDETVRVNGLGDHQTISMELARTLPYLQAVIYEGIRLTPPFTGLLMKEVPEGGDTFDGEFVPGGTRIGVAIGAVLLREDLFGKDVHMFRPERFLECDEATSTRMRQTVELVFGYGRWMCAGKNIAFMELNKAYFELFRRFDMQLVNSRRPGREVTLNLVWHEDLFVKVTERKPIV